MRVSELVQHLEEIAPTANAESWDNVGLLVGECAAEVHKVLLTIDYTAEVAREAREAKCDLIIAYHPPIFDAIKRITQQSLIFQAIRDGIAIYSPHTALDVAEGGTNDMLADAVGLRERSPLRLVQTKASQYKLVVFVPEKELERVSQAMFNAGAGRIGKYSACSFRSPGTGTFFGEEGTNPAVGQSGRLEEAPEIRLETVVPISRIEQVIRALRQSHPYEEPAFDLNQLAGPPEGLGLGRIGTLEQPATRAQLIERIKRELELTHLLVAGPVDGSVSRIAVCAGACGDLLDDAIAQKAELYLTGEVRHHDAIKAARAQMTVICTLHSNSERAVLKRLSRQLQERAPDLPLVLSQADHDPFLVR